MQDDIDRLVGDSRLWAGLNRPGLPIDQADLLIFGIPYDGGVSFRAGAREAPRGIREISYSISPTTEDFRSLEGLKIRDLGDFSMADWGEIERGVGELVEKGKFFIMIGGDHSTTIPVLRGVDAAIQGSLGIIHLDAHFDLCDELGGNRHSHGCTERRALELRSVGGTEAIFFLGVRSIETEELAFFNEHELQVFSAKDIYRLGTERVLAEVVEKMAKFDAVYITLDIDCLDPAYAPGTGTPQFGGLQSRQLLELLEGLFRLRVIGMDIVEVAPSLDDSLISLFAARKLITEAWGHQHAKIYGPRSRSSGPSAPHSTR